MNEIRLRSVPDLREHVVDGTTVVELGGEIDILTAPRISARLDALTAGRQPQLVLDLRPVTFIDCSGLAALCRTRGRVLGRCGRLHLVINSPRVLWILNHTGLGNAFDVSPHLPADLSRAPGPEDTPAAGKHRTAPV